MALPGVGALQDSLAETNQLLSETNRLLGQVLAELQSTNGERLAELVDELQVLRRHLGAGEPSTGAEVQGTWPATPVRS